MSAIDWLMNPEARRNQVAAGSASDDPAKPLTFVSRGEQERRAQFQANRQNQAPADAPRQTTFTDGSAPSMGARNTSYGQPPATSQPSAMRAAGNAGAGGLPPVWETFKREGLVGVRNRPDRRPAQYGRAFSATVMEQDPDVPANALTATGRAATGPGTPARGSAREILSGMPDPRNPFAERLNASAMRNARGPEIPGGGAPTSVGGVFRREGDNGVPEFYNLGPGGAAPERMQGGRGTVSYVPEGSLGNMTTPQANIQAMRAAAARGDFSALERIGAISPRGGGGGGGGLPRTPNFFAQSEQLADQALRLRRSAGSTRDQTRRAAMNRQAKALEARSNALLQAGSGVFGEEGAMVRTGMQIGGQERVAAMGRTPADPTEGMKNLAEADRARAEAEAARYGMRPEAPAITAEDIEAAAVTRDDTALRAKVQNSLTHSDQQTLLSILQNQYGGASLTDAIDSWLKGDISNNAPGASILQRIAPRPAQPEGMAMGGYIEPISFADGGYVDADEFSAMGMAGGMEGAMAPPGAMDMDGMGGMDLSGMGMGAMGMGEDPLMAEYEQYAQGAEQLGLPPISFEEFSALQGDTQMAGQGPPPDASGKMVVDSDPAAGTDSIPAMIDGERPAELDSGEFVIPKHAVMFHGLDKLKKLIAQAEAQE